MTSPVLPPSLLARCSDISWRTAASYPSLGDQNGQRWAWEFLRRSARYAAAFAALPQRDHGDHYEREDASEAIDKFCLAWHVATPIDPNTAWHDLPLAVRSK